MSQWLNKFSRKLPEGLRKYFGGPTEDERLAALLPEQDPRIVLIPLGEGDWLCPYCAARLLLPDWDGDARKIIQQPEVRAHMKTCSLASREAEPKMRPWDELRRTIVIMRMQKMDVYKVCNADGQWLCPYCLDVTDALLKNWDDTPAPFDWFLPQALKHLDQCATYNRAPLSPHRIEVVRGALGQKDIRAGLRSRVAVDPIFRVCDDHGNWIDPFSERAIDEINLVRVPWGPAIQDAIVEYLLSPECPGAKVNWETRKTVESLHRAAGRISAERSTQHIKERTATQELELDILRHQVIDLNVTAGQVEEIQRDLEGAREAQRQMLPKSPPTIPGYEIAWKYDPCAVLGGDFFSFYEIGGGRWGFLIADVSGHGVEAAMIMSMAMKSFSLRATGQPSPAEVLKAVNRDVSQDMAQGKFITACYLVLEPESGQLSYARAGHNPVLLTDLEKGTIRSLEGKGIPLNVGRPEIFDRQIQEETLVMPPGTMLLFYTDGIPEAANPQKEQFGNRRLSQTLIQAVGESTGGTLELLMQAVKQHVGSAPMEDDLTLLGVTRQAL
ncbi:MAG: PP2C family protein-serine/threonine phosphatase [Planctomycetes bacterium]|nr:PP2C family protein-serine/threonine phosphatase [Planctomycetota bacterium]